ncbi:MAG: hypothetical protein MZV64_43365 [Ignavibacteriales bacterium]|nr:hypothetical protein [Ignavibacteriales bacterium]
MRGPVEQPVHELADHAPDDGGLGPGGPVDVGPVVLALLEVPLPFEHLHHGHDGGVGDLAPLQEVLVDVPDRGLALLPDHLHDLEFLGRERGGCGFHDY